MAYKTVYLLRFRAESKSDAHAARIEEEGATLRTHVHERKLIVLVNRCCRRCVTGQRQRRVENANGTRQRETSREGHDLQRPMSNKRRELGAIL